MIKTYVILLSTEYDREKVTAYFDTLANQITTWFFALPYSLYVKSELGAVEISEIIQLKFGTEKKHLVVEITNNYWGRQDKVVWEKFPPTTNTPKKITK